MSFAEEVKMTPEQKAKCHAIIHAATVASGGASFFTAQIPLADSALIVPAQMTMVVGLAGVFGYKLSEGVEEAILGPIIAKEVGVKVSSSLLGVIPIAGNITNAGISVAVTETLGWLIAQKFCEGRYRELDTEDVLGFVGDVVSNFNFKNKRK